VRLLAGGWNPFQNQIPSRLAALPVDFQYLFDAARRAIGYLIQCLTNNFRNSGERNPLVEECFHGYLIGRVQNTCSCPAGFLRLVGKFQQGELVEIGGPCMMSVHSTR